MEKKALIAIGFALVSGAFVSLTSFYSEAINADTIIVYLNSLLHWEPFFWGQDRYGMLLPLMTSWITDPLTNVIAMNTLHAMTAVLVFFPLAKFLFPKENWLNIGFMAVIGFAGFSQLEDLGLFLTPWQIYTPALVLGVTGLVIPKKYWWLRLIFLVLAAWCNVSVGLLLMALTLVHCLERPNKVEEAKDLLPMLLLSILIGYLFYHLNPGHKSEYAPLPFVKAVEGWLRLWQDDMDNSQSGTWLLVIFPLLFAAAYISARRQKKPIQEIPWRRFVVGLIAALGYIMVIGASSFAEYNGYPRRYLIPFLIIWSVIWAGLIVSVIPRFKMISTRASLGLGVIVLTIIIGRFGSPSLTKVKAGLAKRFAAVHEELKQNQCTHVVGGYYKVWEATFYSQIVDPKGQQIWGITSRAKFIMDRWSLEQFPAPRVCYWRDDTAQAKVNLEEHHIEPLVPIGENGNIVILGRRGQ